MIRVTRKSRVACNDTLALVASSSSFSRVSIKRAFAQGANETSSCRRYFLLESSEIRIMYIYRHNDTPRDSGSESTPLLSSDSRTSLEPTMFDVSETSDLDLSPAGHSFTYDTFKIRLINFFYNYSITKLFSLIIVKIVSFNRNLRIYNFYEKINRWCIFITSRYGSLDTATSYGTTVTVVPKRPPPLTEDNELFVSPTARSPCIVNLARENEVRNNEIWKE